MKSKLLFSPVSNRWPLLAMGFVCLALIAWCIHDGHEWGGDFALYIEQVQAINEGSVGELYAANKYAMDNSDYEVGPYLYPFGFPLLLWPVLKVIGIHFIALKIYCGLFLLLSIPLISALFRARLA